MTDYANGFPEKHRDSLLKIYGQFEKSAAEFNKKAVCIPGCSFCCTGTGHIDITTLEGIIILERLSIMPVPMKKTVMERLRRDIRNKLHQKQSDCPFLQKNGLCMIYDIRPFICRRLYSLEKCGKNQGAVIHREFNELSAKTIRELQRLDSNGYSGHTGFILELLEDTEFRKFYVSGGFDPGRIIEYGKSRGLIINCMASEHKTDAGEKQ